MEKPREIAFQVLVNARQSTGYLENQIDHALRGHPCERRDAALCRELVLGVTRRKLTLEHWVLALTKGRKQPNKIQNLLALGLYQLFFLERIPAHAAVSESVELAKTFIGKREAGFVNAVLRSAIRQRAALERDLAPDRPPCWSVAYSHPQWLIDRWLSFWSHSEVKTLLEWNNRPPCHYARRNPLKPEATTLSQIWNQEQLEHTLHNVDWWPEGELFQIHSVAQLAELDSFKRGLFYVQDPSTLLAVRAVDANPGQTVLDLCAAPGGKTTAIAATMANQGRIDALDNSPARLELLTSNLKRLGVTIASPQLNTSPSEVADQASHERILVDAPCSNTGVMRRRVELRWRLKLAEIHRLQKTQEQLLERAAKKLKPGGNLVYSTCSLDPDENQKVIKRFLSESPNYECTFERTLTPWNENVDGAYVATLRRSN